MKHIFAVAALFLLGTGASFAATVSFLDNGVNVDGGLPGNAGSISLGTSTLSLFGGQMSLTGTSFLGFPGTLTQGAQSGIGIKGGTESDEVDRLFILGSERLTLSVLTGEWLVNSVELRSLFNERIGRTSYSEVARVRINNGADSANFDVFGSTANQPGSATLNLNQPTAFTSIEFFVPSGYGQSLFSEFSLASLDVESVGPAVPEPGSLVLMGSALAAVAFVRRRQKSRA